MYYSNYEKIRKKRKLTDYRVADLANVSRSTISEWKSGEHTPNIENLKKIANVLKVSVDELIRKED